MLVVDVEALATQSHTAAAELWTARADARSVHDPTTHANADRCSSRLDEHWQAKSVGDEQPMSAAALVMHPIPHDGMFRATGTHASCAETIMAPKPTTR